jgi:putative salt-induced outer membrane protein YdiY
VRMASVFIPAAARAQFTAVILAALLSLPSLCAYAQTHEAGPWQPPPPVSGDSDWIQLSSGEWLKGELLVLYSDKLEFESDELDLQIFDWEDVKILRTAQTVQIRLKNGQRLHGKLIIEGSNAQLTSNSVVFPREQILTITAGEPKERNYWHSYVSFGANWRSGNTDQAEANAKLNLIRRSPASRMVLDYLGNFSETKDIQTANNHRASGIWDYFVDERLFLRPIFTEYFRDPFQNVDYRLTIGTGLGYQLIETARTEWIISGGPAYQSSRFITVEEDASETESTPALVMETRLDIEVTSNLDFNYDYQLQLINEASGQYNHHMVIGFIVELSSWLDFDISLVWDRIQKPTTDENGDTPEQDDWRLIIGLGFDF